MGYPVVFIPAFEPDENLVFLTKQLKQLGLKNIVVVDDGSGEYYKNVFKRIESTACILHHDRNMGKGVALKTGFAYIETAFSDTDGVVTADADGQHRAEDIKKVADTLENSDGDTLILGVRSFDSKKVPLRSRFGNKITSGLFYLLYRTKCPDTQTGLRGIPMAMLELALSTEGKRFEYEMNLLEKVVQHHYKLTYVQVETVYKDSNKSHFRPIVDSIRIYGRFLRYTLSSLFSSFVDIILFALFVASFQGYHMPIYIATCCARILSGCLNYTLNRKWSFKSKAPVRAEAVRYGVLFIMIMAFSAVGTSVINSFTSRMILSKVIVDTILFFMSFYIQRKWVFQS